MSDDVISISGDPILTSGQADPEVVERLEGLLEAARAGEVVGFAGVAVHSDLVCSLRLAGLCCSFDAIGGLTVLQAALARGAVDEQD